MKANRKFVEGNEAGDKGVSAVIGVSENERLFLPLNFDGCYHSGN